MFYFFIYLWYHNKSTEVLSWINAIQKRLKRDSGRIEDTLIRNTFQKMKTKKKLILKTVICRIKIKTGLVIGIKQVLSLK